MDAVGIIFANVHENSMGSLTGHRAFASLPFGGRYRMIDFILSNMVNADMNNVAVITKGKYISLLDHLGSGKEWDLVGKNGGLIIFPPFAEQGPSKGSYSGRLEALTWMSNYISRLNTKYAIFADADLVCNMDLEKLLTYHKSKNADITIVCKEENVIKRSASRRTYYYTDENDRINGVVVNPPFGGKQNVGLNVVLMERELLEEILATATQNNLHSFDQDLIHNYHWKYNIFAYKHTGYVFKVNTVESYFEANMQLLDDNVRKELFYNGRAIYTKVKDEPPAQYIGNGHAVNSFVTDGCVIEGYVENSILFRGVRIDKGTEVRNSIIMQDSHVCKHCNLDYVIADKNVTMDEEITLTGCRQAYVVLNKGSRIT